MKNRHFHKKYVRRTTVLIIIFLIMAFILIRQLYILQIMKGENYITQFNSKTTKKRSISSTRGKIYDCNGTILAANSLSYSVSFEDNGTYSTNRERNLALNGIAYRISQILKNNGDKIIHDFHIIVDENEIYSFDTGEGFSLVRFKADVYGHAFIDELTEEESNATAMEMMEYLCGSKGFSVVLYGENAYTEKELDAHELPTELTPQEILDIIIIRYKLNTNRFMKYVPITIATNVSEESVAAIMENQSELQGINVVAGSIRRYIDDESMGPILGYTGSASAEELENFRKQRADYLNDSIIGKAGIEQYMEVTLRGTDGIETVYVDNLGKVLRIDEETRSMPVAGNDVYLTIDYEWQSSIYQILKQRVAGILISNIINAKTFDVEAVSDASQIQIPIYDVYNALIGNSVINISKFGDEDASEIEKNLYVKYRKRKCEILGTITNRLTADDPPAFNKENAQIQGYLEYICNNLLINTLGIISSESIDTADTIYQAWTEEGNISLKTYLTHAIVHNWIDISKIPLEEEYPNSSEVYQSLSNYITDYLKTDTGFSKLLYKYMLLDDHISGQELCLVLYEQGVLSKTDGIYGALAVGDMSAYDFMVSKIANLEIEPADIALMPCSASAVVTDVNSGHVLACVSYPGYDSNRLANDMDTEYYEKLALDLSSPFFNKATQQVTAPGSTLKPLAAIVGMQEGLIDDETYIECTGSFELVQPPINCWNRSGHGSIEIRKAIEQSCNYFFNMVGFMAGMTGDDKADFSESRSLNVFRKYADLFGLSSFTGIELTEATPHISDQFAVPSYMGQGTNAFSTSHLARYITTIANSGTVYDLTILDKVIDASGNVIQKYEPKIKSMLDVGDNIWDVIHDGMYRVVQTHSQFNGLGIEAAGKTGTAQIDDYHPDHGLFVGYAPVSEPQYAIAVRIANGYSSGNACLAANDIFEYIFELVDEETILTGCASTDVSNISND